MNYKKINLTLKNPLSFWANFSENERFFWYDRQKNQLIIGADRLISLKSGEDNFSDYPYLFHSQTFFEEVHQELWQDFGGETLAFKHYFVLENQNSFYLTCEESRSFEDLDFPQIHHELRDETDDFSDWQVLFSAIQDHFAQGKSQKIVASRELRFKSETPFNLESILQKLIDNNPASFIFAYQKGSKIFLGASPEILVQKNGTEILSYALAGTFPKTMENAGERLLNDSKNLEEHAIVVRKIQQNLLKKAKQVKVGKTGLMLLKNVVHLRTILTAKDDQLSLTDWAKQLHPTPALGGEPRLEALDFLRTHEKHERGLYAAPLGIIDQKGNGTMIVGIRCALIDQKNLYAYVGCGIVPSSHLLDEFNETKVKLKTILEAL